MANSTVIPQVEMNKENQFYAIATFLCHVHFYIASKNTCKMVIEIVFWLKMD